MQPGTEGTRYFEERARDYDRRSASGVWRWVRERESRALLSLVEDWEAQSVLELGCGSGFYSERLRRAGAKVLGVDRSPAMIAELERKGIPGVCADLRSLSLPERFPMLFAAGVVEFLDSADSLFRAARAHAAPGARLLLLAPRAGLAGLGYRAWHEAKGCPARVRAVDTLREAAVAAGWLLEAVRGAGPLAVALRFRTAEARDA